MALAAQETARATDLRKVRVRAERRKSSDDAEGLPGRETPSRQQIHLIESKKIINIFTLSLLIWSRYIRLELNL